VQQDAEVKYYNHVDMLDKIFAKRILMAKHFRRHQNTVNEVDENFRSLG
jgi:hypothetical protein